LADHPYTVHEVISRGFEARCVGPDGARYLWHSDSGLRVEYATGRTTLITNPAQLPEGVWLPTPFGPEELATPAVPSALQEP